MQLTPQHQQIIQSILAALLPHRQVVVFGSRAANNPNLKPHADVDLCVLGEPPLNLGQLGALQHAFSESALPFRVDICSFVDLPQSFQAVVVRDGVLIYEGDKNV